MDRRERRMPGRLHPSRAAAIVPVRGRITVADFLDISRLVDVQHEYPGEMFLAIDDAAPTHAGVASDRDVLAAVSAYLAFGILPSKVVVFCHSALPETYQMLQRTSALVTSRHHAGPADAGVATRALLFAATCLAVRATTIAAYESDTTACEHAQAISTSFNASRREHVLAEPTIRRLDGADGDGGAAVARTVSPFDSRSSIERRLRMFCASAGGRRRADVVQALTGLHASLGGEPSAVARVAASTATDDDGPLVQHVACHIEQRFAGVVERREALLRRLDDLRGLLHDGAQLARDEAAATLSAMYAIQH
jgi:tryptophanyl-tRNA synthetase